MIPIFRARTLKKALLAFGFAIPLTWVGCASSPIALQERSADQAPWSGTAILLNYAYETSDAATLERGCTLTLHNTNSGRDYTIRLPGRQGMALADIPVASYIGKSMSCPHYVKWELQSFLKGGFTPVLGRINYLGKVIFRFGSNNQSLQTVDSGQAAVTQSLATDIASWSSSWKAALENPFTRQPIAPEMLQAQQSYLLDVHSTRFLHEGEKPVTTTSLEDALRACDLAEQERFPYRLGTLHYTAVYENRKLQSLKKTDHNSFSGTFRSCLDKSLSDFQPDSSSKLQVDVSI